MLDDWERKADELAEDQPRVGRFPVPGIIRRARRIADLSQRELATRAKVSPSTVGRVESGAVEPSLDVLQRLLAGAGLHLVVVDNDGRVIEPMRESEETRDGADRRYPSHLDTILDPLPGEWWADGYGLARPPETFKRDREVRDEMRARSKWEVRVAKFRFAPEPPRPGWQARAAAQAELARRRQELRDRGLLPSDSSSDYDWDD